MLSCRIRASAYHFYVLPLSQKLLLGFILLMIAIFVGQILSPEQFLTRASVPFEVESAWNELCSGKAASSSWLTLSTLFTAALLHGGWDHILYNMIFLWVFAGLVGELLNSRWMFVIALTTAVCGSIGDLILRQGSSIPCLGASGMVMGFEGAYLGLATRWSLPWPRIWPIAHPIPPIRLCILAGIGFYFDITGVIGPSSGTAHGAHLGGFLAGLFITAFIAPAPKLSQPLSN